MRTLIELIPFTETDTLSILDSEWAASERPRQGT
jgi:hypothetical protein